MTTITIEQSLLEQALTALETMTDEYDDSAVGLEIEAIHALRAALAAPATAPEPVACLVETEAGAMVWPIADIDEAGTYCEPDEFPILLYRHPPATALEKTVKEIMEFARHYAANTFSSATLEDKIRRSLAAPATAPEFPADWAQMIHYPECWDTAAYPELRDAIHEALAWSGCSVCKPATAPEQPSWHDAPTVPGLWVSDFSWMAQKLDRETVEFYAKSRSIPSRRWYGPIPEDKP